MNKLKTLVWYALQPMKQGKYYGTIKDWNQTLVTTMNLANATLARNKLELLIGDTEILANPKPKRKLIISSNLIETFESLEYFEMICQRYNTAYSKELLDNVIQLIDGDEYVEIIVKQEHSPSND